MIKFFRRIRFDLMKTGKTSKYIKYAIGEIILVVIGILIALSINNWNEARKLNIKETIYLNGLKADLEQSQLALTRVIKKTGRISRNADTLVTMIKKNTETLNAIQIDTFSRASSGFTVFMPSEGVINDIIGSGKLDMIKNNELRKKIASWEADLRMIRENENISKEIAIKYTDHTSQYFDIVNGKFNETTFLNDKRSEFLNDNIMTNYMVRIFGNSMTLNELYREKSAVIDSLITIIDKELK